MPRRAAQRRKKAAGCENKMSLGEKEHAVLAKSRLRRMMRYLALWEGRREAQRSPLFRRILPVRTRNS